MAFDNNSSLLTLFSLISLFNNIVIAALINFKLLSYSVLYF